MSHTGEVGPDDRQPAAKAPDAFRTISEVAEELDLPQHVLRFWETRFTHIKPLKRGGGRRYYRPQDVELLRGIRHLLYGEGYTIRGVQRLLKEQGLRFVIAASHGAIETSIIADGDLEDENGNAANADGDELPAERLGRRPVSRRQRTVSDAPIGQVERSRSAGSPPNDQIKQLQGTLSELLECKRLLDAAR
jgi:DNA-binding transcriptional MerR regulator